MRRAKSSTKTHRPVTVSQKPVLTHACGIDVHSKFLVACAKIVNADGTITKYEKSFPIFNEDLEQFKDWLIDLDCTNVCMESTSVYWHPVFNALERAMQEVSVCNPKWLSLVKNEKDDRKDAERICDLYRNGMTRNSYIPEQNIRNLREMSRMRKNYVQNRTAEHNVLLACFASHGLKLDTVFSDIRGSSATKITNLIISNEDCTDDQIMACVHRKCKSSREDILKACRGIKLDDWAKKKIVTLLDNIKRLDQMILDLDQTMQNLINSEFRSYFDLLLTVPGISRVSARTILAEIGVDMSHFQTASQFAKWAGLAPGSNESAGKVFSKHVTKGGANLKPTLIQVAWAAVKSKKVPYYKIKFESLKQRMTPKQAIVAIARKILVSIYHMFKKKAIWHPTDCNKEFIPNNVSQSKEARKLRTNVQSLLAMGMDREELLETVNTSADLYEKNLKEEVVFDHFTGEVLVTDPPTIKKAKTTKKAKTAKSLHISEKNVKSGSSELIKYDIIPAS